jgi:prefoldin subunit 5
VDYITAIRTLNERLTVLKDQIRTLGAEREALARSSAAQIAYFDREVAAAHAQIAEIEAGIEVLTTTGINKPAPAPKRAARRS